MCKTLIMNLIIKFNIQHIKALRNQTQSQRHITYCTMTLFFHVSYLCTVIFLFLFFFCNIFLQDSNFLFSFYYWLFFFYTFKFHITLNNKFTRKIKKKKKYCQFHTYVRRLTKTHKNWISISFSLSTAPISGSAYKKNKT